MKTERALFAFRPAARDRSLVAERAASLDTVKVMRNDLTDADVEVVPAPSAAAVTPSKPTPAEPGAGYTNSDWTRLAAKFSVLTRVRA